MQESCGLNRCRLDFGGRFSAWAESADEDAMSVDVLYISAANFWMDDEGHSEDGMHFGLRSCDKLEVSAEIKWTIRFSFADIQSEF